MNQADAAYYSSDIAQGVIKTLTTEMPEASPAELEECRSQMNKAQIMDAYLKSFGGEITGDVIHKFILHMFEIDLDAVSLLSDGGKEALAAAQNTEAGTSPYIGSLPRAVMDSRLTGYGGHITGPEIRSMLNQLFGVNLDAISSLENARISLFSKDQWIVQHEHDLFVVYTGEGDVDVKVYPTSYFVEQTGQNELPAELRHTLQSLGYQLDAKRTSCYYADPGGQAVTDAFKGQTMGAIIATIRSTYAHL
ncbi:hypothetical protein P4H66_11925 [Paenibacillus dokdonensis]|uniref:Uncharacterized protein n=1 Tax=Paenibacillus dokdonensis TaxID=2567944 RepID=A0ABU6GQY8_9BACL|nr:hypothetical protein [Paenibacillus dokdonensis]MEC0240562.1 hypothetical protein [Paenibacillus dokdonensis]